MAKETLSAALISVTNEYLDSLLKSNSLNIDTLASELIEVLNKKIDEHNVLEAKDEKWKKTPDLPLYVIATVLGRLYTFKCIKWIDGSKDRDYLGMYQTDGPMKGIYSDDQQLVADVIFKLYEGALPKEIDVIIQLIKRKSEFVMISENPNYVPLENGIWDYEKRELIDFSPDIVLTKKSPVRFNPNAQDVSITMPDGVVFTTEWFFDSLTDDEDVKKLLFEIIGAGLRPYHPWNRTIIPYNNSGNNGKGTYCSLLENIYGSTSALSFSQFARPELLECLITSNAVICHENSVKNFNSNAEAIKACITGDKITINRKYEKPLSFRYRGLIVECCNDLPKFQDTSESWYRRFLPIPFTKCFTGAERKYIKEDYLKRPEVLEYLVKKVLLDMPQYYSLSCPAACDELLEKYKKYNDTTRQFIADVITENDDLAWSFYPYEFLYDCYQSWMRKKNPGGKLIMESQFQEALRNVLVNCEKPEWKVHKGKILKTQKDTWEPLIHEYELTRWSYCSRGNVVGEAKKTFFAKNDYRGIARI